MPAEVVVAVASGSGIGDFSEVIGEDIAVTTERRRGTGRRRGGMSSDVTRLAYSEAGPMIPGQSEGAPPCATFKHSGDFKMIARRFALGTLAATAFALSGCGMMGMSDHKMMGGAMTVPLSAANEVPPNTSGGTGTAKVDLDGNVLKWTVTYSGTTGPVTAGHFHGPAMAGANAGVVIPFSGSMASPITGTAALTAAQVADLKAGLWYVNLHTAAHPGGELRGQVK